VRRRSAAVSRSISNSILRKHFELYANFPAYSESSRPAHPLSRRRLIIIRENTEGEYVGIEHEVVPGVVESIRSSREGLHRIAEFALRTLANITCKKIHAVHSQHHEDVGRPVSSYCARNVAKNYPTFNLRGTPGRQHLHAAGDESPTSTTCWLLGNFVWRLSSRFCAAAFVWAGGWFQEQTWARRAIFEAVHGSAQTSRKRTSPTLLSTVAICSVDAAPH